MPGHLLHRIARRICPGDTDRVLEPLIADLQREWQDAPADSWRRLQLARGYAGFWRAVASCVGSSFVRAAVSPIDRGVATAAARAFVCGLLGVIGLRVVGAILGLTGLRLFGNSSRYWHRPPSDMALGELMTVGWSVVFAILPAFMYIRRDPRRRWDATASRVLAAGLVIAIAFIGWVGPALLAASAHANGYIINGHVQPAFAPVTVVIRMAGDHSDDPAWRAMLHQRLAMVATAFLLSLIGWQLSAIRPPTIGRVGFWWFALMELSLVSGGFSSHRTVALPWVPPLAVVAILIALRATARRSGSDPPALAHLPG